MNAFARQMTVDDFLEWEAPEDGRWELIEGYLVRMQSEGVKQADQAEYRHRDHGCPAVRRALRDLSRGRRRAGG